MLMPAANSDPNTSIRTIYGRLRIVEHPPATCSRKPLVGRKRAGGASAPSIPIMALSVSGSVIHRRWPSEDPLACGSGRMPGVRFGDIPMVRVESGSVGIVARFVSRAEDPRDESPMATKSLGPPSAREIVHLSGRALATCRSRSTSTCR
jgi:hypothetical protein